MLRYIFLFAFVAMVYNAYGQQDMDLHLNATFLAGKNIIKVKRDFNDPYLWVLAQNNEVYRINSITKVVDNYTSQFSAYANLQFIDIAGVSQDLVYIAANSANVLEYKNGLFKNISTPDGIPGVVSSIGIDYTNNYVTDFRGGLGGRVSAKTVLIGTSNGMCHYDYEKGVMGTGSSQVPARVFESTYRAEMFSALEYGAQTEAVRQYRAMSINYWTIFYSDLWYGNNSKYGENINTAYYTNGIIIKDVVNGYLDGTYMNYLWGTEKGLFQTSLQYGRSSTTQFQSQYLDGVNINKLTSLYGLVAFGSAVNPGLMKENLLVGTDKGLYFSNSGYQHFKPGYVNDYTFFHYDALGTVKINDINVNATSYATPICEDGIWVAATNGLYLLKPDYVPYISTAGKFQAIQFDTQPNANEIQVCNDIGAKANILISAYTGNSIQWYKDGQELLNESSTSLNITQAGDYNAVLYDPCTAIHFETNHLKVTKIAAPVFTFNYPDQMNFCEGASAVISVDNNPLYQYRWYKDGVLIPNNNTPGLTTGLPGKYKIEVSACAGIWVASKEVQLNFVTLPHPVIVPDKTAYCNGDEAILTGTVAIDGLNILNLPPFQYQWFKDGVLIPGQTGQTIKVKDSGKYRLAITSCSGGFVYSDEDLQIKFTTLTLPVISTDKPAYCIGDQATLSVNYPAAGYTINWYLNGNVITANKNQTSITTTQAGNYTVNVSIDQSSCSQLSNVYPLSFESAPTISLERIINTTLCDGQSVDLKATYSGAAVKWSTGETGATISVKKSGTYTATASAAAGCLVSKDINVQFLPNPVLSMPDATLCQFTNDQLTLTAPAGFVKYEWNGQPGGPNFTTGLLGPVNLTVTDQNGCKASQTINITSKCKDIHVPNTFTPNGDGINDKWVIAGLENDLTVSVKIFNRQGEQIFISQGYSKPWDGTYKGKKLPAGVYFYLINAKGSNQVLSGSITVIY